MKIYILQCLWKFYLKFMELFMNNMYEDHKGTLALPLCFCLSTVLSSWELFAEMSTDSESSLLVPPLLS